MCYQLCVIVIDRMRLGMHKYPYYNYESKILVAILLTQAYSYAAAQIKCLRCDRVISPRHCHGKVTCAEHEVCYIDKFQGLDGETLYNTGCRSKELCTNYHYEKLLLSTRTSTHNEVQLCSSCCSGNLCNVQGCGAIGYPPDRGYICYNCPQSQDAGKCDQIEVCGKDDMCHIQYQEEFGDYFYTTKCLPKNLCNIDGSNIFGKRDVDKRNTNVVCSACCAGDLCNSNCYYNKVTGYTLPYTAPYWHSETTPNYESTTSWYDKSTTTWFDTNMWYQSTNTGHQTTDSVPVITDHKGIEFAVVFTPNRWPNETNTQISLLITSDYPDFTIKIQSKLNQYEKQLSTNNHVIREILPIALLKISNPDKNHSIAYDTGVIVTSNKPVSIVGFNEDNCCSADAFSVIPIEKLGTKYILSSYPNGTRSFGVVAFEGETFVRTSMEDNSANLTIRLDAMQSTILITQGSITGSIIESNKPIAVVSGNQHTYIHNSVGNFEIEMLIPVDKFEMIYVVPKIAKASKIILRIIPRDHFTTVYITGKDGFYKNTYQKYVNEVELANEGYFINAQRPVMVTLYTIYESAGPVNPFMTLIPAVSQFSSNYVITVPLTKYENYATVILKSADGEDGLRLNGGRLLFDAMDITPINMFNDVYKSISVLLSFNVTYKFTHIDKNVKFGLIVYGYKNNAAYGYPGGFLL